MPELPHRLERIVVIRATPEIVFRFFTDTVRWASWWGPGSTIDAKPGGTVYIRHPNGVESLGEVLELDPPSHFVFTYGFAGGKPIEPGSSRVTIRLEPDEAGTRLHLLHEFAEPGPRDEHIQGWRFQLSVFANVVANEVYANVGRAVDAWFSSWSVVDDRSREEMLSQIAVTAIRFRDRFSVLDGLSDLTAHIGAYHRFMPGLRLERKGEVRQCHGTVLADWVAVGTDEKERMRGTNVFVFNPLGYIESVTGFTVA